MSIRAVVILAFLLFRPLIVVAESRSRWTVAVTAIDERSRPYPDLAAVARGGLTRDARVRLVDVAEEAAVVEAIQQRWLQAGLSGQARGRCAVSSRDGTAHLLRVRVEGLTRRKELVLTLMSGEVACSLASGRAPLEGSGEAALLAAFENAWRVVSQRLEQISEVGESSMTARQATMTAGSVEAWIAVPAGRVWTGCAGAQDGACERNEADGAWAAVDAFKIQRTEVTAGHYQRCIDAGVCGMPLSLSPSCTVGDPSRTELPATCVTAEEAAQFCAWSKGRLPTRVEWLRAARGDVRQTFPWGDALATCDRAVLAEGRTASCGRATLPWPVASRASGASWSGAVDLVGNVAEWAADGPSADARYLLGGSFQQAATELRLSRIAAVPPTLRSTSIGFRCVR